jgi:hypothetical protein
MIAVSLVASIILLGLGTRAPAVQPSSAPSGHLHDSSTYLRGQEQHGPVVILRVRALVPEKVRLSDSAQGTVRATVLTIAEEIHQIKVQTEEGQRLMLFLDPESLAALQVGAPCLLQITNRATRDASRAPESAEFW